MKIVTIVKVKDAMLSIFPLYFSIDTSIVQFLS